MWIWIIDYHQQGADKASAWTTRLGPLQHEEQLLWEGGLGRQEAFGGEKNDNMVKNVTVADVVIFF